MEHNNDWFERALVLGRDWCLQRKRAGNRTPFLFEEVRYGIRANHKIERPRHSNAWGPLRKAMCSRRMIEGINQFDHARSRLSHAHPFELLVVCDPFMDAPQS